VHSIQTDDNSQETKLNKKLRRCWDSATCEPPLDADRDYRFRSAKLKLNTRPTVQQWVTTVCIQ